MIIGQSKIKLLKVKKDGKIVKNPNMEDCLNYTYNIRLENLTYSELEYIFNVFNFLNYKRRLYDKEETLS